jgi:hypothetical protein
LTITVPCTEPSVAAMAGALSETQPNSAIKVREKRVPIPPQRPLAVAG